MSVENGLGVSGKFAKRSSSTCGIDDGGFGLGVKLQGTESSPSQMMMMMMVQRENHHRSFFPSSEIGCGLDGDGPTSKGGTAEGTRDICGVVGSGANASSACSATTAAVGRNLQQPFGLSSINTAIHGPFKSSGAGMAASLGFPFTYAQWNELQRQAMIYKYMMASIPVPSDLLFPIASPNPWCGGLNLRFSGRADPEPGRCRRTDGKKWRCSRDAAPDQKYCERHLHRGRPRSRKPVEPNNVNNRKKTRLSQIFPSSTASKPTPASGVPPSKIVPPASQLYNQDSVMDKSREKGGAFESVVASCLGPGNRRSKKVMEAEPLSVGSCDQQWLHVMQTKVGIANEPQNPFCAISDSILRQQRQEEPLLLNSFTLYGPSQDNHQSNEYSFLNQDFSSLEKPQTDIPRGFIDAWSKSVSDERDFSNHSKGCPLSSNGNLPVSSLTLSMGGSNSMEEEMGHIQMGLNVGDRDERKDNDPRGNHITSWLSPNWGSSSTPGGPLGEVLRPSTTVSVSTITGEASNPSSTAASEGDSDHSPPMTRITSPSGLVVQKNVGSLFSYRSGSSSPRTETGMQWLSRKK